MKRGKNFQAGDKVKFNLTYEGMVTGTLVKPERCFGGRCWSVRLDGSYRYVVVSSKDLKKI